MASRTTWSQHLIGLLVVAVAVTWLYSALLEPVAFASHEGIYVFARTQQVAVELHAGRFPQSFPDACFGAGFAFPRFYPPLTLFVSAGLALLFGNVVFAVNLSFFLSALLSGVAMYVLTAGIFRCRWIAVGASLLYVSMPYRFVDIYVRAALAEAWTFVWYPLILLGLWHAFRQRRFVWYLPVCIAALLLTHNITAVYFLSYCGVFTLFGVAVRGWRTGIVPAVSVALGILLGMWFLLPQQYYIPTVWVGDAEFMWTSATHVADHRVLPWQFLYSHPKYWFGESSGPGYLDGMSYELGIGQLLLLPLALFATSRLRWRTRARRSPVLAVLGLSTLLAYVASILFMIFPAFFLVVLPKQFAFIQFPWRLLTLTAFFAPILCAVAISRLARGRSWPVPVFAAASVLVVLLVPSFQTTPQSEAHWTDAFLLTPASLFVHGDRGYTVLGEYVPREIDIVAFQQNGLDPVVYQAPAIVGGTDATVVGWTRTGPEFRIDVAASAEGMLRVPVFAYDFFTATTGDGQRLETMSIGGMLGVRVPPGRTEVHIGQRITGPSRVGLGISAFACLLLAACGFTFRRDRGMSRSANSTTSAPPRDSAAEEIRA